LLLPAGLSFCQAFGKMSLVFIIVTIIIASPPAIPPSSSPTIVALAVPRPPGVSMDGSIISYRITFSLKEDITPASRHYFFLSFFLSFFLYVARLLMLCWSD
jgi:hypothetical protein